MRVRIGGVVISPDVCREALIQVDVLDYVWVSCGSCCACCPIGYPNGARAARRCRAASDSGSAIKSRIVIPVAVIFTDAAAITNGARNYVHGDAIACVVPGVGVVDLADEMSGRAWHVHCATASAGVACCILINLKVANLRANNDIIEKQSPSAAVIKNAIGSDVYEGIAIILHYHRSCLSVTGPVLEAVNVPDFSCRQSIGLVPCVVADDEPSSLAYFCPSGIASRVARRPLDCVIFEKQIVRSPV